jgi:hypothetical protein
VHATRIIILATNPAAARALYCPLRTSVHATLNRR